MTTPEQDMLVQRAADKLSEHFDCVLILVSKRDNGGTDSLVVGNGNCCARYGMAREYVIREEFRMTQRVRAEDEERGSQP